jgi:hypothetical protein
MTNATIRTGDVTASQKRQEHFAHANSGANRFKPSLPSGEQPAPPQLPQ